MPSKSLIGIGTWNTEAEYKDIKVTAPDGKVLFVSDFSKIPTAGKNSEMATGKFPMAHCNRMRKESRPGDCRRQILDGLYAHPQGAETWRTRGIPDFVPYRQRR